MNPADCLGHHGAPKSDFISGPITQTKDGYSITVWVTQQCIDCDISRETCPQVFEHNYEQGQSRIKKDADFFAALETLKRAVDHCTATSIGLEVQKLG